MKINVVLSMFFRKGKFKNIDVVFYFVIVEIYFWNEKIGERKRVMFNVVKGLDFVRIFLFLGKYCGGFILMIRYL